MSKHVSSKPCPRCGEHLHWSYSERPPEVHFNTDTGHVEGVSLMLFCIACGYRQTGYANVNREPVWSELKEQ